jgi:hypothetical protein
MLPPNHEKCRDPADTALVCGPGGADPGGLAAAVRGGAGPAPGTSRRVVIPLLKWLDRPGLTRRLADDRRVMREPPGLALDGGR